MRMLCRRLAVAHVRCAGLDGGAAASGGGTTLFIELEEIFSRIHVKFFTRLLVQSM